METKPKAYSYIRISSAGQIAGDGLNRQMRRAREYAEQHGLDLDETLQDVGSGYHGKHVKFGALGGFLDLVKAGTVEKGSYLIVESLDRLSREAVIDAQLQLLNLLKAGVVVVTLIDGAVYREGNDFTQLIISLTIMSRAHEESATKSFRAKERIRKRKQDALAGKPIFNKNIAGWIDQIRDGDSWRYEINQHGLTVQRIFDLTENGVGTHSVARILNQENVPVFRRGINPKERWRDAAVARIIRDETCIGTLSLYEEVDSKRVLMGEPIKNYYPAVISEEQFWRVQRNRREAPHKGRIGKRYANLFQRNTACAACGNTLKMYYGGVVNRRSYYGCMQRHLGGATCSEGAKMFRYDELEKAILDHVSEIQLDAILSSNRTAVSRSQLQSTIHAGEQHLADLERRRENLLDFIEIADDREERIRLNDRLNDLRRNVEDGKAQLKDLQKQLHEYEEQQTALLSTSEMIQQERAIWKTGNDAEVFESRARVAEALRKFITRLEVDFVKQEATVYVGGIASMYMFDGRGNLVKQSKNAAHFKPTEVETTYSIIRNGKRVKTDIPANPIKGKPLQMKHLTEQLEGMGFKADEVKRAENAAKQIIKANDAPVHAPSDEPLLAQPKGAQLRVNPRLNDPEVIELKARRARGDLPEYHPNKSRA